jgi:hypothetical protein
VTHPQRYPARRRLLAGAALALAALLAVPATWTTVGQTPVPTVPSVIRVEEDWSLTVSHPNSDVGSPQVSTQMARCPWTSRFCNFHLNAVDVPSFCVGGLQLQAWKGSTNLATYTSPNSAVMGTDNELVTWTQYLRIDNGVLKFGIGTVESNPGASSTTWGDFSGSGMEITVTGARPDLSNYDPTYSVQNSGVTFGANRVTNLTLVRVRYYYDDGSPPFVDGTPRLVYSATSDPQLNPDP